MNKEPAVTTDTKYEPRHRTDSARATRPPSRTERARTVVRGQDGSQWKDVYQYVLGLTWPQFMLGLACVYLALNALFATLYLLNPGGIQGARPGSFADAFFFSVQTIGSIGYGLLAPKSPYVNLVVTFESFVAIMYAAIATGLIFARFSRPFARVVFSKVATVVPFEGVPALMFRAANQRANQILDATATVSVARQVTTQEGISFRRFEELKLVRARTPLFGLSWTIIHTIDEASPLYGATAETCYDEDLEIIVLLSGTDETFSSVIYARHVYQPEDILFGRRFVDVLRQSADGEVEVDLRHFHETEPLSSHLEAGRPSR
jgi:inward rectifier potassium channel